MATGTGPQLGVTALADVMAAYAEVLGTHRAVLNALNVYPVPDGDTGTNMALTVESVVTEVASADGDAADAVCGAISHGSLMGARGNSGVILSQVLRGIAETVRDVDPEPITAPVLATALRRASDAAYQAVLRPVEGTILTVVRASAEAAEAAASGGASLLGCVEATRDVAGRALARTPEQLPVLAEAGVVDAGGSGYVLLLDALLHVLDGRPLPDPPEVSDPLAAGSAAAGSSTGATGADHGDGDVSDLRYEVMFFLHAPDDTIDAFRRVWAGLGDSIVVVGGDGLWNCHIHTDDIGASIEAALDCGRPRQIRVTDLIEQVAEERWVREAVAAGSPGSTGTEERVRTAVVSVASGAGIGRIFTSLGVQRLVPGGQTMNPSTEELRAAVVDAPGDEVVVLPNNANIIPVARLLDATTDKVVRVVPTRGVAEAFAALLAYDPESPAEVNTTAMTEAAEAVVAGEVTCAVRDGACELGPIAEGDWLGLSDGDVRVVSGSLPQACVRLLDAIVGDEHELVTVIEGDGATDAITREVTIWLSEHRPRVEAEVHHGDQPLYPYLFGVE